MLKFRLFIVFAFLLVINIAKTNAQQKISEVSASLPFFKKISIEVKANTIYKDIDPAFQFSSIAFGIPADKQFPQDLQLIFGQEIFNHLKEDEHAENPKEHISRLIIPNTNANTFSLNSGSYSGKIFIYLNYAPSSKLAFNKPMYKRGTDSCQQPATISGSEWRQGLPAPKVKPASTTPIEHIIIHHSAGSNSDTDYTRTVRNIYLYHTQTNGWDDIGYNYLVAPNGWIFEGRDPQGVAAQDYILGAHFCGKNSNTMGVCVLGDFMQQAPAQKALESLKLMLAWKTKKDHLNPFDSILHPRNNTAAYLVGTIAGHRNGCSTECPGDYLYALIPTIKEEVSKIIANCNEVSGIAEKEISEYNNSIKVYPNPASNSFFIENISDEIQNLKVINMLGQTVKLVKIIAGKTNNVDAFTLPQGLYFIKSDNKTVPGIKIIIQ